MSAPLLIVGCTRRKAMVAEPVPAYQLYHGGLVPALRDRLGARSVHWDRVRFLSAQHGLIPATRALAPYERRLTADRTAYLSRLVADQFRADDLIPDPDPVLVVAEPPYWALLTPAFTHRTPTLCHWISDVRGGWPQVASILGTWGWS